MKKAGDERFICDCCGDRAAHMCQGSTRCPICCGCEDEQSLEIISEAPRISKRAERLAFVDRVIGRFIPEDVQEE